MDLKEKLVELRREKGWTQDELALKVGVTRQAVSKWERGVIAPSTVNLIALGRLYGVSLDELANGGPPEEAEGAETPGAAETPGDAAEITPEAPPPRGKAGPLKLAGAVAAAVLILLVTIASAITIGSALLKEPEKPEDGIIWINDLEGEDIDLTEVQDWTDGATNIIP